MSDSHGQANRQWNNINVNIFFENNFLVSEIMVFIENSLLRFPYMTV